MDELSKRLRDANPHAQRDLPGSAEALLHDLIRGRRTPRAAVTDAGRKVTRPRTRALTPLLSAAGVMLMVLIVVLVVVIDRPAAVAATPDPLALHDTSWTLSSLQKEVTMHDHAESPSVSRLGASYEGWYLQMDEEAARSLIQPQRVLSDPGPNGTGTTLVLAGNPVSHDGRALDPIPTDAVAPDSVLSETTWNVDEYAAAFPTPPPATEEAMREYLIDYLRLQGAEPQVPVAAGDYLVAAVTLLQTWTLDSRAQRALIAVLLDSPGLRIAGSTTDRAGRSGVVLEVAPGTLGNPGFREQLVIDPSHWRVLAVESAVVDGIPEYDVPAGAVTSYTLWR